MFHWLSNLILLCGLFLSTMSMQAQVTSSNQNAQDSTIIQIPSQSKLPISQSLEEKSSLSDDHMLMIYTSLVWLVLSVAGLVALGYMLRKRLKKEQLFNMQLSKQQALLEKQAAELEENQQTILKINKDLEAQIERAEMANKLKTNFLANMSHEIRTPLNSIIGFTDVLMQDKSLSESEVNEYVDIIHTNNELLLKLINDILDLSKLEAGFMDIKNNEFDVEELIREQFHNMSMGVRMKGLEAQANTPEQACMVYFDRDRMGQVFHNFISNAIKYTMNGRVEIGYSVKPNGVRLYVSDTGIGIAAEQHENVFKRFEKLDSFTQGTGLGLSICKAIVDNFGGDIGFESVKGVGSTFWALFPCETKVM